MRLGERSFRRVQNILEAAPKKSVLLSSLRFLKNLTEETKPLLKEWVLECSAPAATVFIVLKVDDITEMGPHTGGDAGSASELI